MGSLDLLGGIYMNKLQELNYLLEKCKNCKYFTGRQDDELDSKDLRCYNKCLLNRTEQIGFLFLVEPYRSYYRNDNTILLCEQFGGFGKK